MKRIKRITALILACAVCAILASCGGTVDADAPDGMKRVEADVKNYTLYVPQSWTVDMSTGTVSAYASSTDRSNVSLTAFAVAAGTTPDSFWSEYAGQFNSTFGDSMKYISPEGEPVDEPAASKTTLGGVEANRYEYRATVTGELYRFMQVVCVTAGSVYILTYTAVDEAYDAHLGEVNDIINSFKFN